MSDFKKGDFVKIKDSEVDGYISSVKSKIRNRVGEITGFSYPNGHPIVIFRAFGRRKEFRLGIVHTTFLELVRREQ